MGTRERRKKTGGRKGPGARRRALPRFANAGAIGRSVLSGQEFVVTLKCFFRDHPEVPFSRVHTVLVDRFQWQGFPADFNRFNGWCNRIRDLTEEKNALERGLSDTNAEAFLRSERTRGLADAQEQIRLLKQQRDGLLAKFWDFLRKNA